MIFIRSVGLFAFLLSSFANADCTNPDDRIRFLTNELRGHHEPSLFDTLSIQFNIREHEYDEVVLSSDVPGEEFRIGDISSSQDMIYDALIGPRRSEASLEMTQGSRLLQIETRLAGECVARVRTNVFVGDSRVVALVVGIDDYPAEADQLEYAVSDALWFEDLMLNSFEDKDRHIRVLLDGGATLTNIRETLTNLGERLSKYGTLIFYFSGHGTKIKRGHAIESYFVPYGADNNKGTELYSRTDVIEDLKELTLADRRVLLTDACFSGDRRLVSAASGISAASDEPQAAAVPEQARSKSLFKGRTNYSQIPNKPPPDTPSNLLWVASSTDGEPSYEHPEHKSGVFTHFLKEMHDKGKAYHELEQFFKHEFSGPKFQKPTTRGGSAIRDMHLPAVAPR